MDIPNKLIKTAENTKKIFDAGYNAGVYDNWDLFWAMFQDFGRRHLYDRAFSNGWSDDTFSPKFPIIPTSAECMFLGTGIEHIDESKVDFSKLKEFNRTFYSTGATSISINAQSAVDMYGAFAGNFYMETLSIKNLNEECTYERTFWRAPGLVDLYITGTIGQDIDFSDCPVLSRDSILRVFDVLSDTSEGKSVVFSLHAVNKVFETAEGARDGSTSEEWLALVNTKPNWIVSSKIGWHSSDHT